MDCHAAARLAMTRRGLPRPAMLPRDDILIQRYPGCVWQNGAVCQNKEAHRNNWQVEPAEHA